MRYSFYLLLWCVNFKDMKQIKGTFNELIDKVPTKAISMMVSQKRNDSYIFTVDIQNGHLLVW